jgi:hypothetical protein
MERRQLQVAGLLGQRPQVQALAELLGHVVELAAFEAVRFHDVLVAQESCDVGFVAQAGFLLVVESFERFEDNVIQHAAAVLLDEIDDAHSAAAKLLDNRVARRARETESSQSEVVHSRPGKI